MSLVISKIRGTTRQVRHNKVIVKYYFLTDTSSIRETRSQVQDQWTFKTSGALDNWITMFIIPHSGTLPEYGKKNVDV